MELKVAERGCVFCARPGMVSIPPFYQIMIYK